jgi:hypothetical protein
MLAEALGPREGPPKAKCPHFGLATWGAQVGTGESRGGVLSTELPPEFRWAIGFALRKLPRAPQTDRLREFGSYRVRKSVSYRVCNSGSLEDRPSTATGGPESGRYRGRAGWTGCACPPRPGPWWSPLRGRRLKRPGGGASRRGTWGPWSWSTPRGVHGGVRGPRGEHPGPPGPRRGGGGASEGPRPPSGQDRLRSLFLRPGKPIWTRLPQRRSPTRAGRSRTL